MDICPKCGLPKQACVCEEIAKSEQKIKVEGVKKKFGKIATIISGIGEGVNIKELATTLKQELACGGTAKNNVIELQGDHRKKIKAVFEKLGFSDITVID
jgi:translation initiation factor 1